MNFIASSKKLPYSEFMLEMLNNLEHYDVHGIAVVAFIGDETLNGYWQMDLADKERARDAIDHDCIDEFIRNNLDRFRALLDDEWFDGYYGDR